MAAIRILIVGGGGVGTMAAYNLEAGGLAETTMVLRSNYVTVSQHGFTIDSLEHGHIESWTPRGGVVRSMSDPPITTSATKYDFIIVCTKTIPDSPSCVSVAELIRPVVTPGHSAILLIQNGLNIEFPIIEAFPTNPVLSGISLIGVDELELGKIVHNDADKLLVGAFHNPNLAEGARAENAAREFVELYAASGKVHAMYDVDVPWTRWRKLLYNAVYNPICAITNMDSARLRLCALQDRMGGGEGYDKIAHNVLDDLILPAMREIQAAAAAYGVQLPDGLLKEIVEADSITEFLVPSMQQDVRKSRFIEVEVILGETLRSGEAKGVAMPVLRTLYCLCRAVQFRSLEAMGGVDVKGMAKEYQPW